MAEPLKNHFGVDIPGKIAAMILPVAPTFPAHAFVRDALDGYAALDLLPRGWKIAEALHRHLPADYEQAIEILLASLGAKLEQTESNGMAPFLYLPHVCFVARYGLDHFEASMQAQYELARSAGYGERGRDYPSRLSTVTSNLERSTKVNTNPTTTKTLDEYIARFPDDVQAILEKIRATIHEAAPDAQEVISYQMPAFKQKGNLVYFAAWKKHIGFYPPINGDETLKQEASIYEGEKGNLQFPLDQPIPYELIRRIVKHQVQQDLARAAK